jgi:hypothetical protein
MRTAKVTFVMCREQRDFFERQQQSTMSDMEALKHEHEENIQLVLSLVSPSLLFSLLLARLLPFARALALSNFNADTMTFSCASIGWRQRRCSGSCSLQRSTERGCSSRPGKTSRASSRICKRRNSCGGKNTSRPGHRLSAVCCLLSAVCRLPSAVYCLLSAPCYLR